MFHSNRLTVQATQLPKHSKTYCCSLRMLLGFAMPRMADAGAAPAPAAGLCCLLVLMLMLMLMRTRMLILVCCAAAVAIACCSLLAALCYLRMLMTIADHGT